MAYKEMIGKKSSLSKKITNREIHAFAELTGDANPIHVDPIYAGKTPFGKCIAQGMIGASLISAVLGTLLPGPGTIYLGQELKFLYPIFPDDTLTAKVEIVDAREDKPILTIDTYCYNQNGIKLISGRAVIKYAPI